MYLTFAPGQLVLFSIDARNRLAVRDIRKNYQAEEAKVEPDAVNADLDKSKETDLTSILSKNKAKRDPGTKIFTLVDKVKNDQVSCLYTAPFLTSDTDNHNHLFIGMNSGNVHIYDIAKR